MTKTTAREQMTAKLDTRSLDQLTSDLIELDKMEYSIETAVVNSAIVGNIAARFPEVDEIVWSLIESPAGDMLTYGQALLLTREGIAA